MGQIKYAECDVRLRHEITQKIGFEIESLTLEKAAEVLKLSRRSIYLWISQGKLNTKKVNQSQRIIVDHLFEYEFELAETRIKKYHKRNKK